MINSLNQIIIEGTCTGDNETNGTSMHFEIESTRNDVKTKFPIKVYGKLAEICAYKCTKGQGIRAVGTLTRDRWVEIVAEHIDFKPVIRSE